MAFPLRVSKGPPLSASDAGPVLAYHERTQHHLHRYAAGPEALDWDAQPQPFRRYPGSERLRLPWLDEAYPARAAWLSRPLGNGSETIEAAPFDLSSLGALLALALGVTGWKSLGVDRWAVRANPSSGNLHPVEAYFVVQRGYDLVPGVYHYCPEDHALERRALFPTNGADNTTRGMDSAPKETDSASAYLALSTVPWRETWKYGERAFRYCQLDVGHAEAALSVAACLLGWQLTPSSVATADLGRLLGLDREQDFPLTALGHSEQEEPELLLKVETLGSAKRASNDCLGGAQLDALLAKAHFFGKANRIDPHPLYSWRVVGEIIAATRNRSPTTSPRRQAAPHQPKTNDLQKLPAMTRSFAELALHRRSAQRFDKSYVLPATGFAAILGALHHPERWGVSLDAEIGGDSAPLDLVLWIHRVEAKEPGVYYLNRSGASSVLLQELKKNWQLVALGEHLYRIATPPSRALAAQARMLHCHQDIASTSCLTLGMLFDFEKLADKPGYCYRQAIRQAGRMGHALYLAAEQLGLRATGIGCFFDSAVRETLRLSQGRHSSLYHLSIGQGLDDSRIESSDPYPERSPLQFSK